jgi:hypothetical protein
MRRNLVSSVIVAFAVATAGAATTPCYPAAPSGCSSSDQKLISSYSEAAVEALVAGDLRRYVELSRELEAKLSSDCRAALAQSEPVRGKCSAHEKEVVLSHYEAMMQAARNGDPIRVFRLFENLEESLSPPCWIALNRIQDAGVQRACSSSELNLVASTAGPFMRAAERFLTTGDLSQTLELLQGLNARLSPACGAALAQSQRQAPQAPGSGGEYRPPGVLDHGGGTYSVPGLGACTPSGCMTF